MQIRVALNLHFYGEKLPVDARPESREWEWERVREQERDLRRFSSSDLYAEANVSVANNLIGRGAARADRSNESIEFQPIPTERFLFDVSQTNLARRTRLTTWILRNDPGKPWFLPQYPRIRVYCATSSQSFPPRRPTGIWSPCTDPLDRDRPRCPGNLIAKKFPNIFYQQFSIFICQSDF